MPKVKLTQKYHNEDYFPTKIREWPTYSTQILNLCNQNAKGTTPKNIGSMKELWSKMIEEGKKPSLNNWLDHLDKNDGIRIVNESTDRIWNMVIKMKQDHIITKEMCHDYAMELIYLKTASGFALEEQAIVRASKYFNLPYRLSNKKEESEGIDGWIGEIPVQVKPDDFMKRNRSNIKFNESKILMITYSKENRDEFFIYNEKLLEKNKCLV